MNFKDVKKIKEELKQCKGKVRKIILEVEKSSLPKEDKSILLENLYDCLDPTANNRSAIVYADTRGFTCCTWLLKRCL